MKLASRRRRIALPGGGGVSAVVALPPGFRRGGRTPAVILAHGAGSDMTNPFLSSVHASLAREGLVAVKFNFPYTEARRRAPDPRPVLERCYRAVVDAVLGDRRLAPPWVAIGGKSLGGRIASYVAAAGAPVRGLALAARAGRVARGPAPRGGGPGSPLPILGSRAPRGLGRPPANRARARNLRGSLRPRPSPARRPPGAGTAAPSPQRDYPRDAGAPPRARGPGLRRIRGCPPRARGRGRSDPRRPLRAPAAYGGTPRPTRRAWAPARGGAS